MAAPVSAAKLIDHGSHSYYDKDTHSTYKTTWKTYQYNKNHIIIKIKDYVNYKLKDTAQLTIKKVNNNKLKYAYEEHSKGKNEDGLMFYSYSKYTDYTEYSANAQKYYYSKIRPDLLGKYNS